MTQRRTTVFCMIAVLLIGAIIRWPALRSREADKISTGGFAWLAGSVWSDDLVRSDGPGDSQQEASGQDRVSLIVCDYNSLFIPKRGNNRNCCADRKDQSGEAVGFRVIQPGNDWCCKQPDRLPDNRP